MSLANQKSIHKNHLIKSSWNSGATGTIRIPLALKDTILAIARELDEGKKVVTYYKENKNYDTDMSELILSQDNLGKVIEILTKSITSKKQGGIYQSGNANSTKKEVIKALEILEAHQSSSYRLTP